MKKIITVLCAAVMALSLFAGCGQKANDNGTTTGGTVSTDGSTSMEKVIGALGESFMEANSGTTFTYNPTGSGSGIQAVSEGRCDIGLSSRALKDDEKASGLKETIVALDGIAIIVNPQNPNAIGYASLAAIKDSVKALTVNGVAPTEATVKDGTYLVQRPFVLVTKEGAALSETAQKFFDFATSADAASIISAAGAVPVA